MREEKCRCIFTSFNGINGGPEDISSAFVPGRILLVALPSDPPPPSSFVLPLLPPCVVMSPMTPLGKTTLSPLRPGDLGPNWTSVNGGGLGNRGELDGEAGWVVLVDEPVVILFLF